MKRVGRAGVATVMYVVGMGLLWQIEVESRGDVADTIVLATVGANWIVATCFLVSCLPSRVLSTLGRLTVLYPLQGLWHSLRTNLGPLAWLWPFYSRADYKREGEARRKAARELELQRRYEPDEESDDSFWILLDRERKGMAELKVRIYPESEYYNHERFIADCEAVND